MKKTGWILVLLLLGTTVHGQDRDAQLWTGLSVRSDLGKKWRISWEEEARFFNNISKLDKLNSELVLNCQISKLLDAGILYRLITSQDAQGHVNFKHRFSVYLGVQKTFAGWTCSLKTAFQKTYPEYKHSAEWNIPENYVRALAEISRELKKKKTEPYTNIEFWYRMRAGEQAFVDQYRFTIGMKLKIDKSSRLDFFYKLQQELQVRDPLIAHIFGVGYRFTFR